MGVYRPKGGFVLVTKSNNFVGNLDVDGRTIKRVCDALGIPPKSKDIDDVDALIDEIRSISIFRST
jgi:hypothetical protein